MPHTLSSKQLAFLLLDIPEAFYGGAAGGGKSDALLQASLQYVDTPGYAALLFRRTYKDLALPGALMSRAAEWLSGTSAVWDDSEHTWRFPSGATLTFGYLEHEADKYRYQSSEFQFIGFDELAQFSETQYRYMFSRLRRLEGATVPLRMRSASNPDGPGLEWVRQRFIIEGRSQGRIFIPALIDDNPYIDRESYVASLNQLDPVTRERLLRGEWFIRPPGKYFRREWFEVVETAPEENMTWVRYWDMAATEPRAGADPDWTAGVLMGRNYMTGLSYVMDVRRVKASPASVEALVKQTAYLDGTEVAIYIEEEPGSSGKALIDHYQRMVIPGYACRGVRNTGSKEVRASPLSSQAEAGNIKCFRAPWLGALFDELEAFPGGTHDDQVDALSGAYGILAEGVADGSSGWVAAEAVRIGY